MNKKIWILQTAGWIFLVFSVTIISVIETDSLLSSLTYDKITGYITAGIMCFSGIIMVAAAFIYGKKNRKKDVKINLFKILNKYSGQITPADLSNETGLEFIYSKKRLDEMHTLGVCKRYITESGVIIYNFPEFEPEEKDMIN